MKGRRSERLPVLVVSRSSGRRYGAWLGLRRYRRTSSRDRLTRRARLGFGRTRRWGKGSTCLVFERECPSRPNQRLRELSYDGVPDRQVTPPIPASCCSYTRIAGMREAAVRFAQRFDHARSGTAADSTNSEQRGLDPSGKDASAPRGYAVSYREFLHQKQVDPVTDNIFVEASPRGASARRRLANGPRQTRRRIAARPRIKIKLKELDVSVGNDG